MLLVLGVRLLRHPDRVRETNRVVIGLLATGTAGTGLVHIARGCPAPGQGEAKMHNAGGMIGFLAASPLESAVSVWVAVPLLGLVVFFGVLVMAATPVHAIPDRLRDLHDHLTSMRDEEVATAAEDAATVGAALRRRTRRGRRSDPDGEGDPRSR